MSQERLINKLNSAFCILRPASSVLRPASCVLSYAVYVLRLPSLSLHPESFFLRSFLFDWCKRKRMIPLRTSKYIKVKIHKSEFCNVKSFTLMISVHR